MTHGFPLIASCTAYARYKYHHNTKYYYIACTLHCNDKQVFFSMSPPWQLQSNCFLLCLINWSPSCLTICLVSFFFFYEEMGLFNFKDLHESIVTPTWLNCRIFFPWCKMRQLLMVISFHGYVLLTWLFQMSAEWKKIHEDFISS